MVANVESTLGERGEAPAADLPDWLSRLGALDQRLLVAGTIASVLLLGGISIYTSGLGVALAVVYTVPIAFGTWFVSARFGIFLTILSVLVWVVSDIIAGVAWSHPLVPLWNALVDIAYYATIVVLLTRLHELQGGLEERVRDRTAALMRALEDRQRLERELLEISDNERRRIGADLHDTLSQHLAGTALNCAVLVKRLETQGSEVTEDARRIVRLIEEGTILSRNVAKGLNPVELYDEGLMYALRDLAASTSKMFGVRCTFECKYPVFLDMPGVTVQLFRIAQEAVTNAAKHSSAAEVVIKLSADEDCLRLSISDDGCGMPVAGPKGEGIGLKIMEQRASFIGATLLIGSGNDGGTAVTCVFPLDRMEAGTNDEE